MDSDVLKNRLYDFSIPNSKKYSKELQGEGEGIFCNCWSPTDVLGGEAHFSLLCVCRRCQPTPNFYTLASFFMEFFSSFSGFPQSTMVSSRLFVPFPNVHLLLVLNLVGLVCIQFLKLSETSSNIKLITKFLLQIL